MAVTLIGIGLRFALVTSPDQAAVAHAPRISDTAFEKSASAVCKQYVTIFNTETTLGDTPTAAQSSAFLSSIATSFDDLVGQLRGLPIAPADKPTVTAWFSEWDTYNTYGHQYAAAVKQGAEGSLVGHDKSMVDGLLRTRNAFAKANHMSSCAFA